MEKEVPQKILDRINKLFALAEGAEEIGSLDEANNAAAKAQELLIKYNLSLMDVEEGTNQPDITKEVIETMGKESKSEGTWIKDLWSCIAHFNYCKVLVFGRGKWLISLHGEEHNRQIVTDLVLSLIPRIRSLKGKYWKEYQLEDGWEKKGRWTRSFFRGAVVGISQALEEQLKAMQDEIPEVKEMGLVKVDQMELYMNDYNPNMKHVAATKISGQSGFNSGKAAGSGMGINRGVAGSSGNKLLN